MIVILGSTHDDILYFESVMTNRRDETLFDIYKLEYGTIFNQEVVLVYDVYTSYVSGIVTDYLLQKHFVALCIVVGKCVAYSPDVKPGDIAISNGVIFGDVDQIRETNAQLGQIPHLERTLPASDEVIAYLEQALEKRSFSRHEQALFISSNAVYDKNDKFQHLVMNDFILGYKDRVVFDCISGGVFLSANLYKITVVGIKVVEKSINQKSTVDNYINVLKQYSGVGRAVVTCIGDIGRNDIMRG